MLPVVLSLLMLVPVLMVTLQPTMNGTLWILILDTVMQTTNTTIMQYQMDGLAPMILMHVNTLVTCTMEPNFMDFVVTWTLAMSRIVVVMLLMKMTTPTPMTMTANWMNATCITWTERWCMS